MANWAEEEKRKIWDKGDIVPGYDKNIWRKDASKAAVNQFTRSIAQEFAPLGIRVNAIACGVMNTGMSSNLSEKAFKNLVKASALKRPAETDEIANVAIFLASEKASYVTGEILNVTGGQFYNIGEYL